MGEPRAIVPGEDLSRFRYHTGATLRRVPPDEPCRILFRDIGPEAMALFLRGRLRRLAGPFAPILYARTADYDEPYVDHEPVGRLVFLDPKGLLPWHSGVATIYVASIRQAVDPRTIGFVPAHLPLSEAEARLEGATDTHALREVFGGKTFDEQARETLSALDRVNRELAEAESLAEPLRRGYQSRTRRESDAVKEWMDRHGVLEKDLCGAWHHLPRERRENLRAALESLRGTLPC